MRYTHIKNQTGLSLIEMMIAMVVGLILVAGVLSIYIGSRHGYGTNSAVGQVQANGRFAMDFIRSAVRQAGYMGCAVSSPATISSELNSTASTLPYNFALGVSGFEYTGTAPGSTFTGLAETLSPASGAGNWSPTLDSSLPVTGSNYVAPGSDVLVVRYATDDPAYVTAITGANQFNTHGGAELGNGNIVVVTNCLSGVVMQLTGATPAVTTNSVTAAVGGAYLPGNASPANLPSGFVGAQVVTPTTAVFYVGQGMDKGPALFEAVPSPTNPSVFVDTELVPGVENMQVLYGIDTNGTRTPSQYVTADNVSDWTQVVSVRVALLMQSNIGALSLPPSGSTPNFDLLGTTVTVPSDTRLRRVFTSDIYIRNEQPASDL
ncbi:MAG: PilW family protein [Gammaproteobacteria bacterium]